MYREDFSMLDKIIYLDNGATTLKPKCMIDKISDYYTNYSANAHRGDYDISLKVDMEYEGTRDLVKEFINASKRSEIAFTSGTTESMNMIVFGYFKYYLNDGDEVILSKSEHASNILPWYMLAKEKNIVIKYVELDSNYQINTDNLNKVITDKTKVISIAGVTNVIGDLRPVKEICELAHNNNILVVIDGAQLVAHHKIDVQELDIDFLGFSAHKMCGPTGVGILYGKYELLNEMRPLKYGGGMNESFDNVDEVLLKELPARLDAGTPNIAGVIGFSESIKFLNKIDLDKVYEYELKLKEYLISKFNNIPHIKVINDNVSGGIVAFNVDGIFPQDVACYLNKYNICLRAGNHCAKILKEETGITNSLRISFYFYNTYQEIDRVVELLSDKDKILKEML